MIQSTHTVRQNNQSLVLQKVISNDEISRIELSNQLNLNKVSVSEIVRQLLDDNIIIESRYGDSSGQGGRRPILLKLNKNLHSVLCVNIIKPFVEFSLYRIDGKLIHHSRDKMIFDPKEDFLNDFLTKLIGYAKYDTSTLSGTVALSIAIHGVTKNNQIIFTPFDYMDEIDLEQVIKRHLNLPVYINNEANLSALAEYTFSTSNESLINVNVGIGVGAGIISNSELLIGDDGYIGEIGHSILFPDGRPCPCGNNGCLDQYASNSSLERTIGKSYSDLSELTHDWNNDENIRGILNQQAAHLGIAINNIISFYNPELVVINSPYYQIIPDLKNYVTKHIKNVFIKNTHIKFSSLGEESILLGALAFANRIQLNCPSIKMLNSL